MKGKGIIILSEARSGSNWLASLMNANRGWGKCREWLNPAVHQLPLTARLTPEPLLEMIRSQGRSPRSGVFALKLFTHHAFRFHHRYGRDPLEALGESDDLLFLVLERRDRLAQAVSLEIARQTQAWKSTSHRHAEPVYDFAGILRCYLKIGASYAYWQDYCALRGVAVQRFFYEDLIADPSPWLGACARFTGHPEKPRPKTSRLQVQRDSRNAEWAERFRLEATTADLMQGAYAPPRNWKAALADLTKGRRLPGQFSI